MNFEKNCYKGDVSSGVDLNRNYGFKFGWDNIGSDKNPCDS